MIWAFGTKRNNGVTVVTVVSRYLPLLLATSPTPAVSKPRKSYSVFLAEPASLLASIASLSTVTSVPYYRRHSGVSFSPRLPSSPPAPRASPNSCRAGRERVKHTHSPSPAYFCAVRRLATTSEGSGKATRDATRHTQFARASW